MQRFLFLTAALVLLLMSCGKGSESTETLVEQNEDNKTCVEILYFHGDMRCKSCVAMERGVSQVLEEDFKEEVKNGKIVFKTIDITTPEGEKIADNYGVTWSSLYLNNWVNGKEERNDLTRFGMQTAVKDREAFRGEIRRYITNYLSK